MELRHKKLILIHSNTRACPVKAYQYTYAVLEVPASLPSDKALDSNCLDYREVQLKLSDKR